MDHGEHSSLQGTDTLVKWRRQFHRYPELGFEEVETSNLIRDELLKLGLKEVRTVAKTGIEAIIRGKEKGPTVMLRADMDALPIQEETNTTYCSTVNEKAHLCGHDAHMAMLLGATKILMDEEIEHGNIKIIFQPAEEGLAGAKSMIRDRVLHNPDVKAIIGLHVDPSMPTGFVSVCPNTCTAYSERFELKVIGQSGHAARPHLTVDPIAVSGEIISALQQIISRKVNPLSSAVLTIGKIQGGHAKNAIASIVKIEGTIRSLSKEDREIIIKYMEQITKGICEGFGANFELELIEGYPPVINDPNLIPLLDKVSKEVLGENKMSIVEPSMGAEDFAYYTQKIPGLFYRLGTSNSAETSYPLHHPKFNIDEDALPLGAATLAQCALSYLQLFTITRQNTVLINH
ncbi:M20 family metallopeptidase [Alkalihalobacillus sp. TS-13]|uniref:M20 metallopeptidase family protein n=1 Tax=Alkalihalobacillus sp. TS-13 TaxID=2842455 RepID=UPI0021AA19D9|nr:M20 family metallopeptidase [Alkalihalobacillus sp. TS-13]